MEKIQQALERAKQQRQNADKSAVTTTGRIC